jgi:hypothetical protein
MDGEKDIPEFLPANKCRKDYRFPDRKNFHYGGRSALCYHAVDTIEKIGHERDKTVHDHVVGLFPVNEELDLLFEKLVLSTDYDEYLVTFSRHEVRHDAIGASQAFPASRNKNDFFVERNAESFFCLDDFFRRIPAVVSTIQDKRK